MKKLKRNLTLCWIYGYKMSSVTLFHNFPAMVDHIPPSATFPENGGRLDGILAALNGSGLWSACENNMVATPYPREAFIEVYGSKTVRGWEYEAARAKGKPVWSKQCGDIYWSSGSLHAVGIAAACSVEAVKHALETGQHGFALVRPPGHHCFDVPAGFCIANNVVLAALSALAAGKKVAILDWDYHFGDGTALAFLKTEGVAFCSIHAERTVGGSLTYPVHKLKGDELRKKTGGRMFNIQWTYDDADDAALCYAMERAILPAFTKFAPDLLLISAGYDSIAGDDLAGMNISPAAYHVLTHELRKLGVPIVAVLEGGYNPTLLGEGVCATVRGLRGEDVPFDCAEKAKMVGADHAAVVDSVADALSA